MNYYEVLGLSRSADAHAIKKAFKSLARLHHPDKGGDAEKFKLISQAASVLQDPALKAAYDRHGEDGLKQQHQDQQMRQQQRQQRHPPKIVEVSVTLEEIFLGVDKSVTFDWRKPCPDCHATGCKPGSTPLKCSECKGQGMVFQIRQLGPGIVQQMAAVCVSCRGERVTVAAHDKCPKCQGQAETQVTETISCRIPKGICHRDRLQPAATQNNEMLGDAVIFVLNQLKHSTFERKGPHLIYRHTAPLVQALTGISTTVRQLDGELLEISSPAGIVSKPHTTYKVAQHGMPTAAGARGDLFVHIDVEFPKSSDITPTLAHILKRCLPSSPAVPAAPATTSTKLEMQVVDPTEGERVQREEGDRIHQQQQAEFSPQNANCRTQ